jgi:nucleoside-diphosphate-sugar epimerase
VNSWQVEFGDGFANKKVMVTGAAGFIGGHLCQALVTLGADVYGLDRPGTFKADISGIKTRELDLRDYEGLKTFLVDIRPELVYHLASLVTARQELDLILPTLHNNLVSTVNLLLIMTELGCERLVVMGSAEQPNNGIPNSPYAATKAAMSLYAGMFFRIYDLPVVTIRQVMAYGPKQRPEKLIPYTILSLLRNQTPKLSSGKRIIDFIYVQDVVRGLLMTGIRSGINGKTIELGTGKGISIAELVNILVELSGSTTQLKFGSMPDRLGEEPLIANLAATRAILGWQPRWSLRDGLFETLNWYKEHKEQT